MAPSDPLAGPGRVHRTGTALHARRPPSPPRGLAAVSVGIGGLALLAGGIGWTSGTWTDRVLARADATAGTFDLQGELDGGWTQSSDADAVELTFALAGLTPSDVQTRVIGLRNVGSADASLAVDLELDGELFADIDGDPATPGDNPVTCDWDQPWPSSIAAGATVARTLTCASPDWTDLHHAEETGSVRIVATGRVD